MDRPPAQETERRVHGAGAVHLSFVQAAHAVGVVEKHAPGVVVQADADPLRRGQDAAAVLPGGGADGGFGDEESAHADGDQREGLRYLEAGVLAAAVVPAVVVVPAWTENVGRTLQTVMREIMCLKRTNNAPFTRCNKTHGETF